MDDRRLYHHLPGPAGVDGSHGPVRACPAGQQVYEVEPYSSDIERQLDLISDQVLRSLLDMLSGSGTALLAKSSNHAGGMDRDLREWVAHAAWKFEVPKS